MPPPSPAETLESVPKHENQDQQLELTKLATNHHVREAEALLFLSDDENDHNENDQQDEGSIGIVRQDLYFNHNHNHHNTHHHSIQQSQNMPHVRRLLYLSHFFAQASEISWQFCLTIFLAALTQYKSLLLVATYGLTTGTAVTLLGSTVGHLVDRTNRLVAARRFIVTENICVILATLCCFQLLVRTRTSQQIILLNNDNHDGGDDGGDGDSGAATTDNISNLNWNETILHTASNSYSSIPTDHLSLVLIVGIHILGAAARVLDEGFLVAIERDWVVVLSTRVKQDHGDRAWLSETNVAMKQIDLACKVAAPAIAGFLIAQVENSATALVVGGINVLSLIVEYYCTTIIYHSVPVLAHLKHQTDDGTDNSTEDGEECNDEVKAIPLTQPLTHHVTPDNNNNDNWECTGLLPYGIRFYLQQRTACSGIALSMLYLNALTFDAIFTAYLVWRGMRLKTIGIWRGISSAIGLLGTCVYHWFAQRMSLELTGLWSIIYEFLCLSLSYGSLFVDDDYSSLVLLIAGVCFSRIGLWVFDIAVTQLQQESIPDGWYSRGSGRRSTVVECLFQLTGIRHWDCGS